MRRLFWRVVLRLFRREVEAVALVERSACVAFLEAMRDRRGLLDPRERALIGNTSLMLQTGKHLPAGSELNLDTVEGHAEVARRRLGARVGPAPKVSIEESSP